MSMPWEFSSFKAQFLAGNYFSLFRQPGVKGYLFLATLKGLKFDQQLALQFFPNSVSPIACFPKTFSPKKVKDSVGID